MLLNILLLYTAVLVAAVLLGSAMPRVLGLTHTRMQMIMSLVSGLMLGVAIFHLLPHSLYLLPDTHSIERASMALMGGLLFTFLLLRVFHFHQHDLEPEEHSDDCAHSEHQHLSEGSQFGWIGVIAGLTIHTVIDGIALAASIQADIALGAAGGLLGLGVFLAILLHKPLDAITLSALMQRAGFSALARRTVTVVYALICPLTTAALLFGLESATLSQSWVVAAALAFSAGVFLCIALSDLLPEIHFHNHDRLKMTLALLVGIGIAMALNLVESPHVHRYNDSSVHNPCFVERIS